MKNFFIQKSSHQNLKPFFNVLIVITTLFIIVFCKMELRSMNYAFLLKSRMYGSLQDRYYKNLMEQAKLTRSERLEKLAHSRMTLNWAKEGQVILVIGERAAVPQ